ncbi:uncharacterized protein [Haliotis cracherodii]|uniref:uncharacterized protein n=1 Tax=Haliotis cracherodii TaxID=6455 RepID=UPI0039EA9DA6
MPTTCAIVNCHNRSGRDQKTFYRIPKVICHQGEDTQRKSERRRRLAAINRSDMKTCSDHFLSGKPHLYDETNPDYVPSFNLGYDSVKLPEVSAVRHERLQKRKESIKATEAAMSLLELNASFAFHTGAGVCGPLPETDCVDTNTEISDTEKLKFANIKNLELKDENGNLREENECLKNIVHKMKANMPEDFENDNDKVKYYTGLPSFLTLMLLFNLISPEMSENKNSSLNRFQKLNITLMRLRLNLPITDLSYRFGVSRATVSKTFLETLNMMYRSLQFLVRWPDRDELHETMPMVFRKYFGRGITCIIDCFEIFIDRPSNMTARAQTWSNDKHHNTAKYLIGITPQGAVSFISEGWGGRVSDKHVTANSKFLDNLINGDVILADRGFEIQDLVALVGAKVKYPAFMRGKQQLSATEVEYTRKIANVRIHVERVIGTVRQKFMILGATCPIDYLITKSTDDCPILDEIVFVCCALTNLCPSVVPFD